MLTRDTQVEDLMGVPGIIPWLIQRGISPFSCCGAFPDTLGRLLELKGVEDVDGFIRELDETVSGTRNHAGRA
jgi:hypothetical protein